MQAETGMMGLTGEPDAPPTRLGLSMVDFMTGSVFALGIVSAILSARSTGQGCDVDVSLFDVALHQTSYPAVWAMNEGYEPERLPRGAHPSIAPSQLVRTADGWGLLMCQTPKFWDLFCILTGRMDLAADPRFADIPARRAHLAELTQALDGLFMTRKAQDWSDLFAGQVPFAPVKDLKSALENPFVAEVGMRDIVAHPAKPEGLHMLASPVMINGQRMAGHRAPTLGEQSEAILSALKAADQAGPL